MILNRISKTLCVAAIAGLGAVLPANAAIISAVSGVINSGGPGSGTLSETFNQSGLSAGYTSGVTGFNTFVATTTHTNLFTDFVDVFEWFSNEGTDSASVTYDLGSVVKIDKMALWNEESSGIGLLDLLFSTDGTTFSSLLSGLTPTDNPLADYLADVFSFASTDLRYVRMDMSRCPQPVAGIYNACAIGEVAFNQVAAVPVPAAGLLLLGALGGLGLMRRRRAA